MTVLIVEDDDSVLAFYQMLFTQWEWDFVIAHNPQQGLAVLSDHEDRIDLVILDLKFNGLEGKGFIEAMYEREDVKNLPVVVATACPKKLHSASWKHLVKPKQMAVIGKPFGSAELLTAIKGVRNDPVSREA